MQEEQLQRTIKDDQLSIDSAEKNESSNSNSAADRKNKKNIWKITGKIFIGTLAAILALLIFIIIFRDPIIKFSVTHIGSSVLGTEVSLDEFESSISEGYVKIANFRIANPEGFQNPDLFKLGSLYFDIVPSALFSGKIIVEKAEIRDLTATGEITANGKFNVTALIAGLVEDTGENIEPENVDAETEKSEKTDNDAPPVLEIKYFCLENINLVIDDHRNPDGSNIHGFGMIIEKLDGSLSDNKIYLNSFCIKNPSSYGDYDLIAIESVEIDMEGSSLLTQTLLFHKIEVKGIGIAAAFDNQGDFNMLEIALAMKYLFGNQDEKSEDNKAAGKSEDDVQPNKAEGAEEIADNSDKNVDIEIKNILISGTFCVYDNRLKIPMQLPFYILKNDMNVDIDIDDVDVFDWTVEKATWLKEQCTIDSDILAKGVSAGAETLKKGLSGGSDMFKQVFHGGSEALEKSAKVLEEGISTGADALSDGAKALRKGASAGADALSDGAKALGKGASAGADALSDGAKGSVKLIKGTADKLKNIFN